MPIEGYGAEKGGVGRLNLPFADAVLTDGWLFLLGRAAIAVGGIVVRARKTIVNLIAIPGKAGYGFERVVRVTIRRALACSRA
jgi:hypothetical protein